MGIPKYGARRDDSEAAIVRALEDIGCQVERMSKPCDLLVKWRGVIYLLEVGGGKRTGTGQRKPEQLEFLRDWQVPIVDSVDSAFRAIGAAHYAGA